MRSAAVAAGASAEKQAQAAELALTDSFFHYHRLVTSRAAELGRRLAAVLETPQESNSGRLLGLGNALQQRQIMVRL